MIRRRFLEVLCLSGFLIFSLCLWTSFRGERGGHDKRDRHYRANSIAITTTILDPDPSFPVWLEYHLRRVDLIIIFMDDPNKQPHFESLVHNKPVVLFNGSTVEPDMTPESRLVYRQYANVNAAIDFALENNISWLMHIDTDELFYDQGNKTWQTWPNVGMVRFNNLEAVFLPYEVDNFFEDCKLFKRSAGEPWFSAYGLGKSAVRLTTGVHSIGPHEFEGFENESIMVDEPTILHYPTPTFQRWLAKYELYGNFSDFWYNDPNRPILPFMKQSRDAIHSSLLSGTWDEALSFYLSWIPGSRDIPRFIESGALVRLSPLDKV